jgi:hypothetical protein
MATKAKNWFEVDAKGMKTLYAGKDKTFILRELIQNAWDEDGVTQVDITINRAPNCKSGTYYISVEDNSPIGFRDIRDAYTLFRDCYKREDPSKRGRFNLGEKQVFSICEKVQLTTAGKSITFDKAGRKNKKSDRAIGSCVELWLELLPSEAADMKAFVESLMPPKGITTTYNGNAIYPEIDEEFGHTTTVTLPTEYMKDGVMHRSQRKCEIRTYKLMGGVQSYLYEMGIPVCPIDCHFSIDVQQRVPLNLDRDNVPEAYLRDVFAEALNLVHGTDISEANASAKWVRIATSDERCRPDAIETVMKARYTEKHAVANPFDPVANDRAIAEGYRVISGSEMSAEEWDRIKEHKLVLSTSQMFPTTCSGNYETVMPTDNMLKFVALARKVYELIGYEQHGKLSIELVKMAGSNPVATFAPDSNTMTVYVNRLPRNFFTYDGSACEMKKWLELIIHELAHKKGHHTEEAYHQELCRIAAELIEQSTLDHAWIINAMRGSE